MNGCVHVEDDVTDGVYVPSYDLSYVVLSTCSHRGGSSILYTLRRATVTDVRCTDAVVLHSSCYLLCIHAGSVYSDRKQCDVTSVRSTVHYSRYPLHIPCRSYSAT